ncbi:hypothetical protein B7463_g1213, partial [Scytalidium lignicola]
MRLRNRAVKAGSKPNLVSIGTGESTQNCSDGMAEVINSSLYITSSRKKPYTLHPKAPLKQKDRDSDKPESSKIGSREKTETIQVIIPAKLASVNDVVSAYDDNHEESDDSSIEEGEGGAQPLLLTGIHGPFLDIRDLEKIAIDLDHNRKRFGFQSAENLGIRKRPHTELAKAVEQQLKDLFQLFQQLKLEPEKTEYEIRSEISTKLRVLSGKTDALLRPLSKHGRSKSNESKEARSQAIKEARELLEDLYCVTIRHCVEISAVAAKSYVNDGPLNDRFLDELNFLIGMTEELAENAINQGVRVQPKPKSFSKNRTYELKEPIETALKHLNLLTEKCIAEFKVREKKEREERAARLRLEKKRKAELEEEENRRYDMERYRENARILAKRMADKKWGRYLKTQFTLQETTAPIRNRESRSESQSVFLRYDQSNSSQDMADIDLEVSDSRDVNGDEYERVQLFGENNTRQLYKTQPLSDEERIVFIELLMKERGRERYATLSEKLDKSMDEIFMWAKDLQETMDDAHEKGRFTAPEDFWTYHIWVEEDT